MSNSTALAQPLLLSAEIERVLVDGDLAKLSPDQRVSYYNGTCKSLGLNPLTRPFAYLSLNGKLVLYARKDCTDQLRHVHKISLTIVDRKLEDGLFTVTVRAITTDGRTDEDVGVVPIGNLSGEARANAVMKAHTKAKRRVTLGVCGLGMLDETEVEEAQAHHGARKVEVTEDGEIVGQVAQQLEDSSDYLKLITEAKTLDELAEIATRVKSDKALTATFKKVLASAYEKRKKSLESNAHGGPDEGA